MGKVIMTVDGNTAAAYTAYAFTQAAAIYPITPSSAMAETVDNWAAQGRKNIFDETADVVEMQSEAGAAGAMHGILQSGTLASTFTASQGLLLMQPTLYKMAGELLPGVLHVSARALAAQSLSIFGDHQDVCAVRQTGCVMLASSSVQEVCDLAAVAHLSAVKGRLPFIHFFDGFRTSHEIQRIEALSYEDYEEMLDKEAVQAFRERALSPNHPVMRGTAQNPDIYFQTREAANLFYEKIPGIIKEYMAQIEKRTGRTYRFFQYYGAKNPKYVVIAMGSVCETIREILPQMNCADTDCDTGSSGMQDDIMKDNIGIYGMIQVHLFRPFSAEDFLKELPESVERIAVLDRTKEPGALGEPLYLDICGALYGKENAPLVIGGRYGLGSKDTTPAQIAAVFDNLTDVQPKNHFTIGIEDDVTHHSLAVHPDFPIQTPAGLMQCKFWGLGSDGTVGANKQAVKIIGEYAKPYVQGYFSYDSKKSGGLTVSHLRFGDTPIRSEYLIQEADYIACHNESFLNSGYDLTEGLKENGIFVLNTQYGAEQIGGKLPKEMVHALIEKNARLYLIDAGKLAHSLGLGNRINMIMQGAFFHLTGILPQEKALACLKNSIQAAYGKKGADIVEKNIKAAEYGFRETKLVPVELLQSTREERENVQEPEFIENILRPMEKAKGDSLPVSTFYPLADGTFPAGTTAYEKRGIAAFIPEWIEKNCIQCNQCSYICPHACIRPFLLNEKEQALAPENFESKAAAGKELAGHTFRIQVSPLDCTGCGNCADICPAKEKALVMQPAAKQIKEQADNWAFAVSAVADKPELMTKETVKGSQFARPLMEFSGACGGCGETPYMKLVTQLFGERMVIANATGCSSIWSASAPSMAYTCNANGKGPAWANSLFEDNAEYGYGMLLGAKKQRETLIRLAEEFVRDCESCAENDGSVDGGSGISEALEHWLAVRDNPTACTAAAEEVREKLAQGLKEAVTRSDVPVAVSEQAERTLRQIQRLSEIQKRVDFLVKRSQWIVGGDGWAYDIGYGGLDHVLASGADVNVLVFDTEIYSNTGGQASKSTPAAAVAKFAADGKRTAKKDIGAMAMTYGNVYVAQIAMGADKNQTIKAILEAERYDGPSLLIAYAPCISHGIKEGMGKSMASMKQAVDAGYWHLYRYNPQLIKEGKNPFALDSRPPKASFTEFLRSQLRYAVLEAQYPKEAKALFAKAEEDAGRRYQRYREMAEELKELEKKKND